METKLLEIQSAEVLLTAGRMKAAGCRLVQILCTKVESGLELTYSFDKDYELTNVRCLVPEGEGILSITGQYWYAFLWENEMHDLFGLRVELIAPEVDYKGKFFRLAKDTPWNCGKPAADQVPNLRSGLGVGASVQQAGGEQNG